MASYEQERNIVQAYARQYQTNAESQSGVNYGIVQATNNAFDSLTHDQQLQIVGLVYNDRNRTFTKRIIAFCFE